MRMKKKYKFWVARDADGEIGFFKEKPKRSEYFWCSEWYCWIVRRDMFPDLTWEDEPIEVELRPAITDLDTKAQEYANNVTDNEEIKGNHVGAFAALCELLTIADEWNKADGFKAALCCQDRFTPWFKYDDATGKYVYANTAYSWTYVGVRIPRLSFKTKDRAEQFGKQFVQLYNKIFLID